MIAKQTKQIVLTAVREVEVTDGVDAARKLIEWQPSFWNAKEGEQTSAIVQPPPSTGYCVRECRGHFHVTCEGEDLALNGDPFPTREAAELAMAVHIQDAALYADTPKEQK